MQEGGESVKQAYRKKSAGRVMTSSVPVIFASATVEDAEKLLKEKTAEFDSVNYFYVLDRARRLIGVVSVKEIFRAGKSERLRQLMKTELITAHPYTNQEHIAYLALRHSIKAIPIVNKQGEFLGIVPSDKILQILEVELTEDILRFGGVAHSGAIENVLKTPIATSLEHRTPWLVLGLFGGIATAGIISSFEHVLQKNILLVAYIPLIVYVAGAMSNQIQAFIIRDLARNPDLKFFHYFIRQTRISLFIAGILGIIFYALTLFLHHDFVLSTILAFSLLFTAATSLITGLIVPYVFGKLKFDPADASAPIGTIMQDLLSVSVYLLVTGLIL